MKWKSKKTLREEARSYRQLWHEAEGDAERYYDKAVTAEALLKLYEHPTTLVLAPTHRMAEHALHQLEINPRARNIHTVTTASRHRIRGLRLQPGARVIQVAGWSDRRDGQRLVEDWQHLLLVSGVSSSDLWWNHQ